jgi:hypothetical protein
LISYRNRLFFLLNLFNLLTPVFRPGFGAFLGGLVLAFFGGLAVRGFQLFACP